MIMMNGDVRTQMEKIVKDFLENQNLKKDEFVKLIQAYKNPEAVEP